MRLSLTSRYALLVTAHLAADPVPHTAERLAREAGVPHAYIPKVIAPLMRRRLITSQRGIGGGYLLACDPAAISAWDVIETMEAAAHPPANEPSQHPVDLLIATATAEVGIRLRRHSLAALAAEIAAAPA